MLLVTNGKLVDERIPTRANRFRFNGEDGKIVERLRCAFLPRAINIRRGRREAGPDRAAARVAESELCEDVLITSRFYFPVNSVILLHGTVAF